MEFSSVKVIVAEDCLTGRGVRAKVSISQGEIIEWCPVLVVPAIQTSDLDKTLVYNYYYGWEDGAAGIALGYGSFYNHSAEPNADYIKDFESSAVKIVALAPIEAGTEIFIDYSRGGTNPLWFEPL